MRLRYAAVAAACTAIGVLVGWGAGSAGSECDYTCPAQGPCPEPPDCGAAAFNWAAAIVLGLLVAAVIATVAVAVFRRSDDL